MSSWGNVQLGKCPRTINCTVVLLSERSRMTLYRWYLWQESLLIFRSRNLISSLKMKRRTWTVYCFKRSFSWTSGSSVRFWRIYNTFVWRHQPWRAYFYDVTVGSHWRGSKSISQLSSPVPLQCLWFISYTINCLKTCSQQNHIQLTGLKLPLNKIIYN